MTTVDTLFTGAAGGIESGVGTSTVGVSSTTPATLTVEISFDIDSDGLLGAEWDFYFDRDNADELDVLSFEEISWSNPKGQALDPVSANLFATQESSAMQEGRLLGFEGLSTGLLGGSGPANTTLTFARMVFVTNPGNASSDGADLLSTSERDIAVGQFFANDGTPSGTIDFNLTVNAPEPGAVAMIALGVGTLLLAGRGRRS